MSDLDEARRHIEQEFKRATVKFFLTNGGVVDWPIPDPASFNFPGFAKTVRADGFFLSPDVYIRHEQIVMIALASAPVVMPAVQAGQLAN